MRFTWHSDRRANVSAWIRGDGDVAIIDEAAAYPVQLSPEELDDLTAKWLAARLDGYQYETIRRLLATWGETPQGVRFKRYGEP